MTKDDALIKSADDFCDAYFANLTKVSDEDLEQAVFENLREFAFSVKSTAFGIDEVGFWATEYKGEKYYGPSVDTRQPAWATHVYWFGK